MTTLLHDLHNLDHFIHVLPCSNQALQHQHLVVVEHVTILSPHHLKQTTNKCSQTLIHIGEKLYVIPWMRLPTNIRLQD